MAKGKTRGWHIVRIINLEKTEGTGILKKEQKIFKIVAGAKWMKEICSLTPIDNKKYTIFCLEFKFDWTINKWFMLISVRENHLNY